MFGADAFSEVLDIVHVRGETARVVTSEGPLQFDVPAVSDVSAHRTDLVA